MTNLTAQGLNIDECSDEELEAAVERGEVGYCEIDDHPMPMELIRPPRSLLHTQGDLQFCAACESRATAEIVDLAMYS